MGGLPASLSLERTAIMRGMWEYHPRALGTKPTASSRYVTERTGGSLAITSVLLENGDDAKVSELPDRDDDARPKVYCPFCGRVGVYRQKHLAEKYTDNFAHHDGAECKQADLDNVLHSRAIACLCRWLSEQRNRRRAVQARVLCHRCKNPHTHLVLGSNSWDGESPEERVTTVEGHRIPDVVVKRGDTIVAVFEVAHTNLVDERRRHELEGLAVPGAEFKAESIVDLSVDHGSLPQPHQHWNLECGGRNFLVCSQCRATPDVAKSVRALVESHPRARPDHDGLSSLAHYLGLPRADGVEPKHLFIAFQAPEQLRALDPEAAAALARRVDLVGSKLEDLVLELLGWPDWGVWKDVSLQEVLENPHGTIIRRARNAVRDTGQLNDQIGRLEQALAQADQIHIRLAREDQTGRFGSHITVELARRASSGSTAVDATALFDVLCGRMHDLSKETIEFTLRRFVHKGILRFKGLDNKNYFSLTMFGGAERSAAEAIVQRVLAPPRVRPTSPSPRTNLTDEQRDAADLACENPISVITGAAGTGKSTLIREIVSRSPEQRWIALAPTWKALASLAGALGNLEQRIELLTVARFNIYAQGRLPDGKRLDDFRCERYGPECSVVVDEVGFLDAITFRLLLGSAKHVQRLVLVGDPYQLPSIGPGAVLRDLGNSALLPHIRLQEVHRASSDSGIAFLSTNLLDGRFVWREPDVRSLDVTTSAEIVEAAVDEYLYIRNNCDLLDIQIIASVNSICEQLNTELQTRCNRQGEQVHESLRVRDPFIATQNVRDILTKGETGRVVGRTKAGELNLLLEGGRAERVPEDEISGLTAAYCITIHKSQGSQWKHVIVGLPWCPHEAFVDRAMLYTAVTRARESLTLIGQRSVARKAAKFHAAEHRETLLGHYLRKLMPPVPDGDST